MIASRTPLVLGCLITAYALALTLACDPTGPGPEGEEETGIPVLGDGVHELSGVTIEELLTADDGLSVPRDLALHPDDPSMLWVLNRSDSMLIAFDVGSDEQTTSLRDEVGNYHFMPEGSAFAFGLEGTFATAHEEDTLTQGTATPEDFMGPTLWDSDPAFFDGGHPSHLDMLHNSPNAMGVAWETGNVFWVFDGYHGSLTRYDFNEDHGYGGEDHRDGIVARYAEDQVKYVEDVPSHLELDRESNLLYVADTGNNRIGVLDITTGEKGSFLFPNYDGGEQYAMDGTEVDTLIDGEENYHVQPSGLALHDEMLFVADHGTGEIVAYTLDGELVDYLDTGLAGSLMGIAFDPDGRLYAIDSEGERVLRISPKKP